MENQKASKTFLCANLHLHTIHHLLWSMGPEKEKATQTLLSTSLYFIWSTGARKKKRPATTSSGQKVLKKKRPAKPSSSPAAISITSGQARKLNFWQHFEFCFHGNNWSQCKSGIFKQGRGTDKVYSWHFHMSCFNSTGLAEIIRTLDCLMFYQLEYPFCLFTTWYRIISLSRFGVFTLIISYFTLNILCPHVLCV